MVRQWQKLFYGRRYSMTCLRSGKACEGKCGTEECECPPYTPDFIKLAESYGAKGMRVFKPEDIKAGKRIGIDYAEEAADYLWRFYL